MKIKSKLRDCDTRNKKKKKTCESSAPFSQLLADRKGPDCSNEQSLDGLVFHSKNSKTSSSENPRVMP